MFTEVRDELRETLTQIRSDGLEKPERVMSSPQSAHIEVNGRQVKRAKLEPGDTFTVGATEVTFTTERE